MAEATIAPPQKKYADQRTKLFTPDGKFTDRDGKQYPCKICHLDKNDMTYNDGELCCGDGSDYSGSGQPWLKMTITESEIAGAKQTSVPIVGVMIYCGRNSDRGDKAHWNFQYWRDVGWHRHKDFIIVGRQIAPMPHFIEWQWRLDDEKDCWIEVPAQKDALKK